MAPGRNAWQIRAFAPDDLTDVSEVVHRSIEVSYAGVYPPRAVAHFHEHHTADKIAADAEAGLTLVIERDGRIVGTGTLVGDEIARVYIEPDLQGQGIGTAIMRELERRARELGLAEVELYASVVAKPFYDRLGYVVTEEGAADVGDGQVLKYYRMARTLAP